MFISKKTSLISRETSTSSISKHYALNNLLLNAFEHLRVEEKYHVAYAVGMRFVETAILEIPKHGYFFSSRHEEERVQSSNEACRVAKVLQEMLENDESLSSLEEEENMTYVKTKKNATKMQKKHLKQLSYLAEEHGRNEAKESLSCQEMVQELENKSYSICGNIWTEYSEILLRVCPSKSTSIDDGHSKRDGKFGRNDKVKSDGNSQTTRLLNTTGSESSTGTPGIDMGIDRALYLSGLQITHHNMHQSREYEMRRSFLEHKIHDRDFNDLSNMTTGRLCSFYKHEFAKCLNFNKIKIHSLGTFQGRINGSINGCTVIAPLLCISFFENGTEPEIINLQYLGGLSEKAICEVIDIQTPKILPEVRRELGLTKDALIIPSDVHDSLIEKQLLLQNQFVTVVGGNILDDRHLNEFIQTLTSPKQPSLHGKRVGATLFFHEHVVAIQRIHRVVIQDDIDNSHIWFDLIDSLPNRETLSPFQLPSNECYGSDSGESISYNDFQYGPISSFQSQTPNAVRIRCFGVESLRIMLRWHAFSKFSASNYSYIDKYDWEDSKSDFDPRVFQAFVWSSTG